MKTNTVKIPGYINFPKNFGGLSTATLSVSINTGTSDTPVWRYVNIKLNASLKNINLVKLNKKRVQVTGNLSGSAFTPKNSDKEVTTPVIFVKEIKVLERGTKSENSFQLHTMTQNLEEFGERGIGGSTSVSFKDRDNSWKYVNIPFSASRALEIEEKSVGVVKGFVTANVFTPSGSDKEVVRLKFAVTGFTPDAADTETTSSPEQTQTSPSDEDEIPF